MKAKQQNDTFQMIPGRTTRKFEFDAGVVVIRNCGSPKIYVNVGLERAKHE